MHFLCQFFFGGPLEFIEKIFEADRKNPPMCGIVPIHDRVSRPEFVAKVSSSCRIEKGSHRPFRDKGRRDQLLSTFGP